MRDTARCDACATPVGDGRVLCQQCGVDVDDITAPVVWPEPVGAYVGATKRQRNRSTVRLMFVAAVAVAVLAGVLWRGASPPPDTTLVMPEAQVASSEETSRTIVEIGTVRVGGGEPNPNYPDVLVDGDRDQPWFGDAPALGLVAREQLVVRLDEPAWVSRVVIGNGVHADLGAYDAHGRARTVEMTFDGDVTHIATLLDIGRLRQQVSFDRPILTTGITFTVLSVYPGFEHRDVALSSLDVRGYEPTDAQRQFALEQAELAPARNLTGSVPSPQ